RVLQRLPGGARGEPGGARERAHARGQPAAAAALRLRAERDELGVREPAQLGRARFRRRRGRGIPGFVQRCRLSHPSGGRFLRHEHGGRRDSAADGVRPAARLGGGRAREAPHGVAAAQRRNGAHMKPGVVALLALAVSFPGIAASEEAPAFTESEVRAILAHGPWPAPAIADPSNRVSGKREAVEFGERLFFEQRLSVAGKFSCGTCHVPERNWTDNQTRGAAAAEVDRNTPTLMNIRLGHWFGWDGASDSLWAQSIRPILDARELGASPRHVAELMRNDEQLACRYRKTFGEPPSASDDERVLVDIAKALAAFMETLESPP